MAESGCHTSKYRLKGDLMTNKQKIPLFPVTTIAIGPVYTHGVVTVRFGFVTNLKQPIEKANPGRHYALTPDQVKYMIERLGSALHQLQSAAHQPPPDPKH